MDVHWGLIYSNIAENQLIKHFPLSHPSIIDAVAIRQKGSPLKTTTPTTPKVVSSINKTTLQEPINTSTVLPVQAANLQQPHQEHHTSLDPEAAHNEQKYLHKKFKRIASTATDDTGGGGFGLAPPDSVGPYEPPSEVQHARLVSIVNGAVEESRLHSASCDSESVFCSGAIPVGQNRTVAKVLVTSDERLSADPESSSRHIQDDQVATAGVDSSEFISASAVPGEGDHGAGSGGGAGTLNNNNNIGRNVCHYCNLNCTKPSVLEKHIRSHTNERPYPCVPCGFAFKTKSNLYKHCRSRAHQLRAQGAEVPLGQGLNGTDDDISAGSDQELSSSASGSDEVSDVTFIFPLYRLLRSNSYKLKLNYYHR